MANHSMLWSPESNGYPTQFILMGLIILVVITDKYIVHVIPHLRFLATRYAPITA